MIKKMMDLLKKWFKKKSELEHECSECILHTPTPSQEGNQQKKKQLKQSLYEKTIFTAYAFGICYLLVFREATSCY